MTDLESRKKYAFIFLCVWSLETYKCPEICYKLLPEIYLFAAGTPGCDDFSFLMNVQFRLIFTEYSDADHLGKIPAVLSSTGVPSRGEVG